jgi:hypothetical protein
MSTTRHKMVTGVFRNRMDWKNAYEWLLNRGYTSQEINLLMSEHTRSTYIGEADKGPSKAGNKAEEGMGVGGAIGTAIGAAVGAIAAVATSIVIPGLGILVAGPLAGALAGGGAGAVTGGVIGGIVGLGIPEPNAKVYHDALRDGGVVIGVNPHNDDEVDKIKREFERHHGESICYC